jgi:hypothetical protein
MPENWKCQTAFGEGLPYQISAKYVKEFMGCMENPIYKIM